MRKVSIKLIALDMDGVVNSEMWYRSVVRGAKFPDEHVDPACVERINRIMRETGAKVVFSSSWRVGRDAKNVQEMLNSLGFDVEVQGVTPILWDKTRGEEIHTWLQAFKAEIDPDVSMVILDDDNDMEPLMNLLVQTSRITGITDENADEAIRRLNG